MDRRRQVTEAKGARSAKAGQGTKQADSLAEASSDTLMNSSSATRATTHKEGSRHLVEEGTLKRRSGPPDEVRKVSKKRSKARQGEMRNHVKDDHPFLSIQSYNAPQ